MRDAIFTLRWKPVLLAALCASGMILSAASYAGDAQHRDHGRKHRGHDAHWRSDKRPDDHWDRRYEDRRVLSRRQWDHRHVRRKDRRHYRPDWYYHGGQYWAPPQYRGRYCSDRRHHHGVHYHVTVRDYYDYYYPRYRPFDAYGAVYRELPAFGANASVIISIPLF